MTNQDSALILIVDDDDVTRIHLRQLMEYAGYQVVEARNGCEAITTYSCVYPDMVILDAIMPVMDGFTCCAQLQTLPNIQETPVLMITATYEPAAIERAFAVGATDYITKPIQWVIVSHRIRHLLKAYRAMKQLRQQTEQAQLRETQIKIALEAARMGTWDWDITTNQVTWSDNKERLFGLPEGTFDGKYETFLNCVHHQDRDFVNNSVMQAVQTGAEYDIEFRILLPDGSIRWLASKGVVFRNVVGEPVRMPGIVIDITKRKQAEEELQQFAFIASHDLQEPLRKIKTFSERLINTCGDSLSEPAHDYLERMQSAVLRMQTLIEGLLTLSRLTTRAQPAVSVNLAQITQEVLSDLEVRIQQTGATIEVGDLPTIKADPLQMRQLMQNLISNALKFHRPQVPPIVKIYSHHLNNQSDSCFVGLELCQIIVEDNGIGFEQKYGDRIFNLFQRLHNRREYEGTGIGLTICRKIAERHFGRITAQSKPGQGTKFMVILPINSPT